METTIWVVIAIAFIIFCILMLVQTLTKLVQDFKKSKKAYEDSLEELKKDPNNPNLRQEALKLGRTYSEFLGKDEHGHRKYDEQAIMNDINAACVNSVGKVEVTNPTALSGKGVSEEIEGLANLFRSGVITSEEFERGKNLFLGSSPDKAAGAVELLNNLSLLKQKGVISDSEFNAKKWEILSERLLPRQKY